MNKLAKIFISMGMKLMTQQFISKVVVLGLEVLVKKTETNVDNRLLEEVKKALDA